MRAPLDFLELPARSRKPRASGLTHVLDKGTPLHAVEALLDSTAPFVDLWKFGWGTAYVDRTIEAKTQLLVNRECPPCIGGTLLEIAWAQGKAAGLLAWARATGFSCVEVSNGAVDMPPEEKWRLIECAARDFIVVSEVGSKNPDALAQSDLYVTEASRDLEHGARWVIVEGRESGAVGLYNSEGTVREDIVFPLVEAIGVQRLIFEAPRKEQQAWFIRTFGSDVNLGNIVPTEVLGLETLRLGLRADTIELSCPDQIRENVN